MVQACRGLMERMSEGTQFWVEHIWEYTTWEVSSYEDSLCHLPSIFLGRLSGPKFIYLDILCFSPNN